MSIRTSFFVRCLLALAAMAVGVAPGIATAQELPETAALLERLEAAEARIAELETESGGGQAGFIALQDTPAVPEADDGDWDDFRLRFLRLEAQWQDYQAGNVADEPGPTFELGGRIHTDIWTFPENSDGIGFFEHPDPASPLFGNDPSARYLFRRIRLEFQGNLWDNMIWRMQIDFNNPSSAEMKDVFIGWTELPGNQRVLLGNQKRPLGWDHLNSSRFIPFPERPLVVEAFNEDARRPGLTAYGITDDVSLGWAYGIYGLENITRTGRYIGDSLQLSGNARVWGSPWYDEASGGRGWYHWGIAGMVARPDGQASPFDVEANEGRFRTRAHSRATSRWIDTGRIDGAQWYEVLGLESVLNLGAMQIASEFQTNWVQRDETTPGTGRDLFFHGAYVYLTYFLTGEHMAYNRRAGVLGRAKPHENFFLVDRCSGGKGHGWGAWQIGARYAYLDLTDHDVRGGVEHNLDLVLNWHWNPYARVQFTLIWGDIRDHREVGGFTGGNFFIAGTRFAADF